MTAIWVAGKRPLRAIPSTASISPGKCEQRRAVSSTSCVVGIQVLGSMTKGSGPPIEERGGGGSMRLSRHALVPAIRARIL